MELFTDPKRGCSVPDLAKFYESCVVNNGVVTSIVNGHEVRFGAKKLGELLGVSSEGFDVYVREDKSILGEERLLALTQRLAQKLQSGCGPVYEKGGNDVIASVVVLICDYKCFSLRSET